MTVHFFEGFDITQWNFDWAYGIDDLSNYLVPWAQYDYQPGAVTGRALRLRTGVKYTAGWGGGTNYAKLPRGGPVHVYFALRYNGSGSTTDVWNPLFFFNYGDNSEDKAFGIQINSAGWLRLARGGMTVTPHYDDATTAVLSSSFDASLLMTEDRPNVGLGWAYIHLMYDPQDDEMTLWVNGNLMYQVSVNANVNANYNWTFAFNRAGGVYPEIDHFVITDAALPSTGTHAIAVNAMVCVPPGKVPNGTSLTGALVMDDQVIKRSTNWPSDWDGAPYLDPGFLGHSNPANEIMWVWGRDPRDNTPWTAAKLNEIQAWGLCARSNQYAEDNPGVAQRVTSCFLTSVETTTKGYAPLVQIEVPGAAIFLEDIWEKTNEELAYSAHLSELPRDNVFETDKWISTNKTGCLLFNAGKRPFDWTGITFAQEYREDFYDFVTVDGAGNNFSSWFITGYSVLGDSNKAFQNNYVTVNYQYTEGAGGAYLQPVWEYSLDPNTGRWGTKQQVYKEDQGYKHGVRKLKARGHGKALQFKVSSVDQKDFIINGWGMFVLANQLP